MEKSQAMKRDWIATARTLSEALPYLQRYDGKIIVVKFGGHAMGDADAMERFARDIVLMKQCGVHPVVVHGGGPQINDMLERLQIKSEFTDGLRVTTAESVEVVEMVLAGVINKRIVSAINAQGGMAVGLCGKDANLIICEKALKTKKDPDSNIERVLDLGFVGEPVEVNPRVLQVFIESDFIPVVAPVGAGAVAGAMKAARLMLLTDVQGVKNKSGEVLTRLTKADVERLIADGTISGGMIPKVETALYGIDRGVEAAVILDGRTPHGLLLELFTQHGAGTLISA